MDLQSRQSFFQDQGHLVIENLLSAAELVDCQAEIQHLHRLADDLEAKGDPASSHFQREPYARDQRQDGLPVLRKIEQTRQHSPLMDRLAHHPRLVPTIQALLGPDLLLFRSTLMLKPAFHGSVHALHQDSAYWPIDPPALATVSIALDDATATNGCLKVVPGSHRWGLREWGRIAVEQDGPLTESQDLSQADILDVPLKAGSALVFHSLMVHGSGANTSPQSRHTALYAYFSPHVRYMPKEGGAQSKTFPVIAGLDGRSEYELAAEATPS